jgi:alkylated DNA repair dioxygenase AlkB
VLAGQKSLLGGGEPSFDERFSELRRIPLDESAWVEYQAGWVRGHETLMHALEASTHWHQSRREMYEKMVDVPRLVAGLPEDGPGHPLLEEMRAALGARYRMSFARTGLGLYRDGRDSVAWHGDYIAREMRDALVATISLGEPRRFLMRPKGGGASRAFSLGWGDLIVMGGSCQRTWQHCVPKVAHAAPRLTVMFRPAWEAPPGAYRPPGY